MIGAGYVGLVSSVCFAEFGADVICVDKDASKVEALQAGRVPIYEPGLSSMIAANAAAGRLKFTMDLTAAVSTADAIFIAVGTPSRRGDGHADLTYVFEAAKEIAAAARPGAVIVTKSTVPVGSGRQVEAAIREERPDLDFDVASNPEFLREGSAIGDFMRPDRVVIGAESPRAANSTATGWPSFRAKGTARAAAPNRAINARRMTTAMLMGQRILWANSKPKRKPSSVSHHM